MIGKVRAHLDAGNVDRAREALGDELHDFSRQALLRKTGCHPLLTREGLRFFAWLRPLIPALVAGRADPAYLSGVLAIVEAAVSRKAIDASVVLLANHAMQVLAPAYAEKVGQAIQDVRFELGQRASNVESAFSAPSFAFDVRALAVASVIEKAGEGLDEAAFSKVENLTVADFDAPEDAVAGLPPIVALEEGSIHFECMACGGRMSAELSRAGSDAACACAATMRVPIPSLVRVAEYLRATREAAMGCTRCRICRAVVQKAKNALTRAGFCSPWCARQGCQEFGEVVPREGKWDGGEIVAACECRTELRASAGDAGSLQTCPSCALLVWIPHVSRPAVGKGVTQACARCGRKVKSNASRCLFCGAPTE